MSASASVTAWTPALRGVHEVLHARLVGHAYPAHSHDAWTLLIVDDGVVRYDLDRYTHAASSQVVTLLPPYVAHDGTSARPGGFRKRVLYLDADVFGDNAEPLLGRAVDNPAVRDAGLRHRIGRLHSALWTTTDELAAESELALVIEHLHAHLRTAQPPRRHEHAAALARRLRDLLEAELVTGVSLEEAAALLHANRAHLVRTFRREYGIPPHRYLTNRRVELARTHLLAGCGAAEAAALSGFHDQAHLTRHFTRLHGIAPGRYARGGRARGGP